MVKTEEMLKNLEELINTPSVVGFYPEIHKKLAAIRAGNNIMPAVFGVGCMNSQGYERTSIQAIEDCVRLTLAYVLSV